MSKHVEHLKVLFKVSLEIQKNSFAFMHSIWSSCEEALENLLSQTFVHLLLDMYGMTML